jgi:Flp pilus assembly protein TadG
VRAKSGGHSVLEFAFFLPYLLFLFVGTFDWGFYSWALVATENAARTAALYTSSSSSNASNSAAACAIATAELAEAPNIAASPTVFNGTFPTDTCTSAPLTVTATAVSSGADGSAASQVSVTYQTPGLIPIPGALSSQMSITRVVEMRVR